MNGPTFAAAPPTHSTALVPAPVPRARVPSAPRVEAEPPGPAVLTYLRLHWLTILFCGTLLGGALGYAAYSLVPVKYESFAELQVASNPFSVTSEADPQRNQTAFLVYIKTARIMMRSEPVLTAAVNDPVRKIDKLQTLAREADPVKFLRERLVIETPDGSEIVRISLEGEIAADLKPIVDAVVQAFKEQVLEREITAKRQNKLELEKIQQGKMLEINKRVGITSNGGDFQGLPPASPAPQVTTALSLTDGAPADDLVRPASALSAAPALGLAVADSPEMKKARALAIQARIEKIRESLGNAPAAIARAEKLAGELKAKADALKPQPPSVAALAAAANDPDVIESLAAAQKYEGQLREAGTVNDPNSTHFDMLRRKAKVARDRADALKLDRASKLENRDFPERKAAADELAAKTAAAGPALRAERANLEKGIEVLTRELNAIRVPRDSDKLGEQLPLYNARNREILTHGESLESLTRKLTDLDLELAAVPSRVSLPRGGASVPREKDGKRPLMAALAATLAGFGLVAAALVGNEIRTRKVSALGELAGTGVKVLGVVPFSPDSADPVRRGDIAEAIHKLRAAVAQEWLGRGPATILVTSPLADEGKAFCAYRLALSLAQAGARTLLVDFDLRSPAIHVFAGIPNGAGVADVLRGEADARANQVILPSGLVVLPAGEWAPESAGDAVGQYPSLGAALDPLLYQLRAGVDVLVVHGHAILTAADSVELARRSDAVLLCAAYRETRVPLLKRAAERVAGMAGPTAAVVYIGATRQEALC